MEPLKRRFTREEVLKLFGGTTASLLFFGCRPSPQPTPKGGPPRPPGEQTMPTDKPPEPARVPTNIAEASSTVKSAVTSSPETSSSGVTFEFGDGVTPEQQKEIKNGVTIAQKYLLDKAGIKINGVYVYASSNSGQVVDKHLGRTIFAPKGEELKRWRENMEKYATAFVGGRDRRDFYIITSNPGWTRASPIIGGPVAEGRIHTIVHEYCHLFQIDVGAYETPPFPHWLNEGWAHYVAARALDDTKRYPYIHVRDGHVGEAGKIKESLKSMESAYGFYEAVTPGIAEEYSLAFLATEFLVKGMPNDGIPALTKFWQETGKRKSPSEPWEPAFQIAFGKTPGQFYSEFETYRFFFTL